ncbi:DeoR/GlpR family DNA-binding transcription regulator [Deinococcus cellulosilyticus]|uniref:DeoR family transcriptional regulator n=1 Tax=Deinococcus cellulosilyticus (strain DSM 18568 / NBRC 106333 / KACC 11606 / 5516J-15) TaxID=1223518 RepID=A0A511N071_DEIC1|nr:DeoR/GlpR family DNA-binding transcription regulator [Deinococcus cellulosilyticus]GEM46234.1 DeoR family transcriptional regulator [Deinococcus cellulosilyticus NBRC 106333 = KACC 11606]
MLTTQRKQLILGRLKADGQIVAKTLSQELGLSEDTIRRDLRELAAEGLLQRVHGGALPASPTVVDLQARKQISQEAKAVLGKAAANLIQSGQVVLLDGGTTHVHLVRHLPADLKATFVTHSPTIAVELGEHTSCEVVLLGGRLFRHSMVAMGAATLEALSHIRPDLFFMGVTGVHAQEGLSTGDLEEAHLKRALSQRAAETIVLADSKKIGVASQYVIAPVRELGTLIVEKSLPEEVLSPFEGLGITLLRA